MKIYLKCDVNCSQKKPLWVKAAMALFAMLALKQEALCWEPVPDLVPYNPPLAFVKSTNILAQGADTLLVCNTINKEGTWHYDFNGSLISYSACQYKSSPVNGDGGVYGDGGSPNPRDMGSSGVWGNVSEDVFFLTKLPVILPSIAGNGGQDADNYPIGYSGAKPDPTSFDHWFSVKDWGDSDPDSENFGQAPYKKLYICWQSSSVYLCLRAAGSAVTDHFFSDMTNSFPPQGLPSRNPNAPDTLAFSAFPDVDPRDGFFVYRPGSRYYYTVYYDAAADRFYQTYNWLPILMNQQRSVFRAPSMTLANAVMMNQLYAQAEQVGSLTVITNGGSNNVLDAISMASTAANVPFSPSQALSGGWLTGTIAISKILSSLINDVNFQNLSRADQTKLASAVLPALVLVGAGGGIGGGTGGSGGGSGSGGGGATTTPSDLVALLGDTSVKTALLGVVTEAIGDDGSDIATAITDLVGSTGGGGTTTANDLIDLLEDEDVKEALIAIIADAINNDAEGITATIINQVGSSGSGSGSGSGVTWQGVATAIGDNTSGLRLAVADVVSECFSASPSQALATEALEAQGNVRALIDARVVERMGGSNTPLDAVLNAVKTDILAGANSKILASLLASVKADLDSGTVLKDSVKTAAGALTESAIRHLIATDLGSASTATSFSSCLDALKASISTTNSQLQQVIFAGIQSLVVAALQNPSHPIRGQVIALINTQAPQALEADLSGNASATKPPLLAWVTSDETVNPLKTALQAKGMT